MIAALVRVGKNYLPWRALAILSSNFAKGGAMRRRPEIENLRKLGFWLLTGCLVHREIHAFVCETYDIGLALR